MEFEPGRASSTTPTGSATKESLKTILGMDSECLDSTKSRFIEENGSQINFQGKEKFVILL